MGLDQFNNSNIMKTLMKLIIVAVMLSITSATYSQSIAVKAGLNLATMRERDDNSTYSNNFTLNPGFHVGANVEFTIYKILSLETGLFFLTKGYKSDYSLEILDNTYHFKHKTNLYYIDLPITLKLTFVIGKVKIFGSFGEYLGLGLFGNNKTDSPVLDDTNTDISWGSGDKDDLRRFDFGMTFNAGVEFYSIIIGACYDHGFANISAHSVSGYNIKNRVLGISVGYRFGMRKKTGL